LQTIQQKVKMALELVQFLGRIGLWDVVVPFVLVFTLVFAFLEKTKVLGTEKGKPKVRLNVVVAFVIGFFVIALTDVLHAINVLSQYVVVLIVAGLMLMILLSFFGIKDLHKSNLLKWAAFMLVFGGGLYVMGLLNWVDQGALIQWLLSPLAGLIVFILILYFVFQKKPKK